MYLHWLKLSAWRCIFFLNAVSSICAAFFNLSFKDCFSGDGNNPKRYSKSCPLEEMQKLIWFSTSKYFKANSHAKAPLTIYGTSNKVIPERLGEHQASRPQNRDICPRISNAIGRVLAANLIKPCLYLHLYKIIAINKERIWQSVHCNRSGRKFSL